MNKFIFVTGGVVSGLGKGITAASLGRLLKNRGLKVSSQKLDPYMNVDPGTMSPFQHGEVFVTEDGTETDLDLGHYERFIDENLNKYSNLTSGRVYFDVLTRERRGEYLGQTVQIIPHVTNAIKDFILKNQKETCADISIIEIGGTIGDIESVAFLEAIRQLSIEVGRENCLFIHVCLVPYISGSEEFKSKPTQHSVRELQAAGIHPDIIVTRSDRELPIDIKEKISLFCNVSKECVILNKTLSNLYEVPLMLYEQGMDRTACHKLRIENKPVIESEHKKWQHLVSKIKARRGNITIALVGKYIKLHDSYLSIVEALQHASFYIGKKVSIKWVDSDSVTKESAKEIFSDCAGIIIPGGFGIRGAEGMINSAWYARKNRLPYFGICLGMQILVIEYARSVLHIDNATSREFSEEGKTETYVIDLMEDQKDKEKGGTMRLGVYPCKVAPSSLLYSTYTADYPYNIALKTSKIAPTPLTIMERHRHRYEFNNKYKDEFVKNNLTISGISPDERLVEAVELKTEKHKFYLGVQYHPEFKSRPDKAHPLFIKFLSSC